MKCKQDTKDLSDLQGKKFGRLTVIKRHGSLKMRRAWLCQCDCGKTVIRHTDHLRSGHTNSCGCLNRDSLMDRNVIHGKNRSKEHRIWCGIKSRCLNPKDTCYHNYGGRGIGICERWMTFENFLNDMGDCPDGMTIDRIDNDKDYDPGNCRWATAVEQANNSRKNHMIEFEGKTLSMAEWSRILNIPYSKLRTRINTLKWSAENALKS